MGLLDTILGRTKPVRANLDALFALPTAALTLQSAGGLVSEHRPSTSSRDQPGRTASGAMANSAAFRSVPRLRLPQTSH